jgi:hydroxymethylpyrimidine/phosphomethylpyrimidine kinase
MKRALSIAGSDSGGGAGIQADLKTFSALGVFGMTVLTAITAQNTTGVTGVHNLAPEFVGLQLDAVASDIGVDAAKTGMLSTAEIIEIVAAKVREHAIPNLVVDPVMIAKSGAPLLRPDAMEALKRRMLPLATVVTPNLHETSALVGRPVETLEQMREAGRVIHALGPRYVFMKGGHLQGEAVDLLFDGSAFQELRARRVPTKNTHGIGCVVAAAIAAELARHGDVRLAVTNAKRFITAAIEHALALGKGYGPANSMASLYLKAGWPPGGPEG